MYSKKNRAGLALGAAISLIASLFGGIPAASAATESAVVITPTVGSGTSVLVTDDFQLQARTGSAQVGVTGTWSYYIVVSTNSAGLLLAEGANTVSSWSSYTQLDSTVVSVSDKIMYVSGGAASPRLAMKLDGTTSMSASVTVDVTPYQDMDGSHTKTNGDIVGDTVRVTFVPWATMGAAVTLQDVRAGDRGATASFTLTAGAINYDQLDSNFTLDITSTNDGGTTTSAVATGPEAVLQSHSESGSVDTAPFTTSAAVQSVSAQLLYNGLALTAPVKKAVSALTIAGVTVSAVTGANVKQSATAEADARVNTAFKLNAFPHTTSITTSMAVDGTWSVSAVGTTFAMDADSGVIINGTTYTDSATLLASVFTQAAGTTTIDVTSFGQGVPDSNTTLTFKYTSQLQSKTLQVNFKVPTYTVAYTPTNTAGPAGTAKTFALEVDDQWSQASIRTDQRVAASVLLSGSVSATVSSAVSGGVASVTVTPTPAARTGSATVTFTLQTYNQDTTAWDNTATDTATWNVYDSADGITAVTATTSASISYGIAYSWSAKAVSVTVANSYSDVTVAAAGLLIRDKNDTTVTGSDTLTVQAVNRVADFEFTGTKAGTYTVTFTSGAASTTSLVTIQAAPSDKGSSIVWDTTVITPGKTKVVTGTLLDANGNPVDTTGGASGDAGTASMLVTYYGDAGIIVGTMPTETDVDGKFRLSVLTSAADKGTLTITATYMKDGASTATADKVTSINAINVGASSASAGDDQKVNAGSFKGYVAVYAKGYAGQRLSAKVGNDWVVVASLASNFERVVEFTGAGYTIAVRIYIDRVLVDTITVTTK